MTVKIIRKTAETHEVTDKMREAAQNYLGAMSYDDVYRVMEAARVVESGMIEKIEVKDKYDNRLFNYISEHGIHFSMSGNIPVAPDEVIQYADALREMAQRELDKQINGGK
jgi:hypothetical protein